MRTEEMLTKLDLTLCDAMFCTMRMFREQREMTQLEIAEEMGVHAVAVSKMERHTQRNVQLMTIAKFAMAVDLPTVDLVAHAETMWDMAVQVVAGMSAQRRKKAYESMKGLDRPQMLTVLITMGATDG